MKIPIIPSPSSLLSQRLSCRGIRGTFCSQRQLLAVHPARAINTFSLFESPHTQGHQEKADAIPPEDAEMLYNHKQLLKNRPEEQELTSIAGAPIFTYPVLKHTKELASGSSQKSITQYALLGADAPTLRSAPDQDSRMLHNVSTPTSFFICGSQGSGKSHTLSCILENCLIPSESLGRLPNPLSGIVFHYDAYSSAAASSPCEAAYLSSDPRVNVRVLCSPSNTRNIKDTYSHLENVTVEELRFDESDLNTKRMLDLMSFDSSNAPLYMHNIQRILREMHIRQQQTGNPFIYRNFLLNLKYGKMDRSQNAALRQRLDNLETFLIPGQITPYKDEAFGQLQKTKPSKKNKKKGKVPKEEQDDNNNERATEILDPPVDYVKGTDWTPKAGELIIVDLSCPTITSATASSLFNICLSIYLSQKTSIGRVVALDEAHKYMDRSSDSGPLTDNLLSTIRLQRHLGVRVVISTQEPTISPKLLDLSSTTIIHRFTSPEWFEALRRHLAGVALLSKVTTMANKGQLVPSGNPGQINVDATSNVLAARLFGKIVTLKTGEALVFAPSAVVGLEEEACPEKGTRVTHRRLAHDVLHITVRSRITADGGKSIMAS
ncbi:hypothetical protein F4810DRAFT_683364 [Camillea tinctor]|nr:hypothetical protein F4810DRAFT_683364 [Camillea tinctor]